MSQPLEEYREWQESWGACHLCSISNCPQNRKVLGLGPLTARILGIGEAPGRTERSLGEPFVGRAGQLLRAACVEAGVWFGSDWYLTNTIACFPRMDNNPNEFRKPSTHELQSCSLKNWQLIDMMLARNLKGILLIGRTAEGFYTDEIPKAYPGMTITTGSIEHPSSLLRKGIHNGSVEESAVHEWRKYVQEIKAFYEGAIRS